MKKQIILCSIITSCVLIFSGCAEKKQVDEYTNKLESVSKSINDKEFNSAERQLDELLRADIKDKEVENKVQAMKDKLTSEKEKVEIKIKIDSIKDLLSKNEVETANKELESIVTKNITDEGIKKSVDEIKISVATKQKENKNTGAVSKSKDKNEKSPYLLDKKKYIDKLNNIENGLENLKGKYSGTTMEMKQAAAEEYKRWDDALNEIYGVLKNNLDSNAMNDLKNKQMEWIKYRDDSAKEESEKAKGGTLEGVIYISTQGKATKERCYELVDKYMK